MSNRYRESLIKRRGEGYVAESINEYYKWILINWRINDEAMRESLQWWLKSREIIEDRKNGMISV